MQKSMNIEQIRETESFLQSQGVTNLDIPVPEEFNENGSHKITGDGSITPTTHIHESAIFLDEDKTMFATPYAYANIKEEVQSHVVRFGINARSVKLQPKELLTQDKIIGSKLSQPSYAPNIIAKVPHNQLEINLIKQATKHLMESDAKTVLVDIFARHITNTKEEHGLVKTIEDKIPETHTVVLYRVDDSKVFLIDPSNYYFSSHIANADINSKLGDVQIQVPSQKGYKIYSPLSSDQTGFSEKLWRDCIDIAVKLAFGFNNLGLNTNDIRKDSVVKLLTNNPTIDNNIFYSNVYSVRKKQTSDTSKVKEFNNDLKTKAENFNEKQDFLDDAKIKADKSLLQMFEKALILDRNITAEDFNKEVGSSFLIGEKCVDTEDIND